MTVTVKHDRLCAAQLAHTLSKLPPSGSEFQDAVIADTIRQIRSQLVDPVEADR